MNEIKGGHESTGWCRSDIFVHVYLRAAHGGRGGVKEASLTVNVYETSPNTWLAMAIEAMGKESALLLVDETMAPDDQVKVTNAILDNHAHVVLGVFPNIDDAMTVGDNYAVAWLAGDVEAMARCRCTEVGNNLAHLVPGGVAGGGVPG